VYQSPYNGPVLCGLNVPVKGLTAQGRFNQKSINRSCNGASWNMNTILASRRRKFLSLQYKIHVERGKKFH